MITAEAPARLARTDRRMAAAWTRLVVGALVVAIPIVAVLIGAHTAAARGSAQARSSLHTVATALEAEHRADGAWPADVLLAGTRVVDDQGVLLATVPDGVGLAYERSADGGHVLLTVTDRGQRAVFDSRTGAR